MLFGIALFAVGIPLISFALRFPAGDVAPRFRRLDTAAWIAYPLVVAGGAMLMAASFAGYLDYYTVYALFGVFGQLIVACVFILAIRYARMMPVERARTVWALVAFGGSMLAVEGNVIVATLQTLFSAHLDDTANVVLNRVAISLSTVAELLPVLAIYPILRYRHVDLGFFVNRATLYSVLTLAAVGTLAGVNWLAERLITERLAIFVQPLAAILIGLGYMRVRAWTQSMLERTFFRARYRAEERLAALANGFASEDRVERIDHALTVSAAEALSLTSAVVFRDGLDTPDPVLATSDSLLVVELRNGSELIGFVYYGPHQNGTEIDSEETAMLQNLCRAAATAYRVAELQSEVTELRAQLFRQTGSILT